MRLSALVTLFAERLKLPGFELHLNEGWASTIPEHRDLVRRALRERVGADSSVLDLSRLPALPHHAVSISHCKEIGGFALSDKSTAIGFDVEVNRRLAQTKLALVAHDTTELSEAPSLHAFWTTKEAAFKCLQGANQPRGLKDLRVGNWQAVSSESQSQFAAVFLCEIQRINGQPAGGYTALMVDDGTLSFAVCYRSNSLG